MAISRPGRWRLWVGVGALLVIVFVGLIVAVRTAPVADEPRSKQDTDADEPLHLYGFSLSPKSFGAVDYPKFFETAAAHANTLSWAGHYSDLDKTVGNAAKTVLEESRKKSLVPILITGPDNNEVFDGVFVQGFRESIVNFVTENEVPYLGLGNEIDEIYHSSPARYAALMSTLQQVTTEVKDISPRTKVFTVFQLERTKGLRGGLFGGSNDPNNNSWGLVEGLVGFDLVAFTTYPCLIYKNPTEIPDEYYSDIANHTGLPVAFTEIGWFRDTAAAGWESNETEQATFIARFEELNDRLEPKLVIWPFLYDQAIKAPFEKMGLLGLDQDDSPGLNAWDAYRSRKTTVTE